MEFHIVKKLQGGTAVLKNLYPDKSMFTKHNDEHVKIQRVKNEHVKIQRVREKNGKIFISVRSGNRPSRTLSLETFLEKLIHFNCKFRFLKFIILLCRIYSH